MTKPKIIGLIAVVAAAVTAFSCWQTDRRETCPKIKVENDGGIINGINHPAATALAYDPYFIHVNDTPHLQILAAKVTGGAK
jgi:hypothetical protein